MNRASFCFLLVVAVSLAQLQCYVPENNADCAKCLKTEGCGFCGVIGQGYCVPGNEEGSQLSQFNITECPSNFWKFGGESECTDPVRIISTNATVNATTGETVRIKWASVSVTGSADNKTFYDALEFVMETQGEDDGKRHIAFAVTYASAVAGDKTTNATIFAVAFENIFEFIDREDDGLDIPDLQNDPEWQDSLYNIDSFSSMNHNILTIGGVEVFRGNVTTIDGKLTVVCYIGSGTWTYTHPINSSVTMQLDPYQMKCDILVNDWEYKNHTSYMNKKPTLGIQGYVASATLNVDLNTTAANDNRFVDGEVSFGEGIGFFRWSQTVSARGSEGEWADYDVIVKDIPLPNNNETNLPPGTEIKTTIFSVNNKGKVLNTMIWDPKVGIDPVAASDNSTSPTTPTRPMTSTTLASTTAYATAGAENASSALIANLSLLVVAILALF